MCSNWVPQFLTQEQLRARVAISRDKLKCLKNDPGFLSCVTVCDESRIYHYEPKAKIESTAYRRKGASAQKKVRQAKSADKVMRMAFFDGKNMIYQHVVSRTTPKTTVNVAHNVKVLKQLRRRICAKCPEILKTWIPTL